MLPLYYAMLKHMQEVDQISVAQMIEDLKPTYAKFKQLKPAAIQEGLKSAVANGLLDEAGFELDENENLVVYYKLNEYGNDMINKYIG